MKLLTTLILLLMCAVAIASFGTQYSIPAWPSTYDQPVDANDMAFKFFARPAEDWAGKFGDSERTAILYNVSLLHARARSLEVRVAKLEARLNRLEWGDPNDAGAAEDSK